MRARRRKFLEDGEGGAAGGAPSAGDSGASSPSSTSGASSSNTVSVITGPASSYDDIRNGASILGRDNFVMPGDRRGRTPKKKHKHLPAINTKEVVLSECDECLTDETKVTLTMGQLKRLFSEFR